MDAHKVVQKLRDLAQALEEEEAKSDLLPEGKYDAILISIEPGLTIRGRRAYWKLGFRIEDRPGKVVWAQTPREDDMFQLTTWFSIDPRVLVGRRARITVGVQSWMENHPFNSVKKVKLR